MKVSACVMTKNEGKILPRCLSSLPKNIDEIVLLDHFSTDRTVKTAKKFGCRVFKKKYVDSAYERNYCASLARNNWVLFIDADEILGTELKRFSERMLSRGINNKYAMYCIPRKTFRKGKFIKEYYSYPNFKPFIFDKTKCKFVGKTHETLIVDGKKKFIPYDLLHIKDSMKNPGHVQARYNRLSKKTRYVFDISITQRISNVWFVFRSMFFDLGFYKSLEGWKYTFGYILHLYKNYNLEMRKKI